MAENLERDKRSRTAHKTHVQRIISETNKLLTIFDERKLEHRQKYKHYKSTLEQKRDVINDLDKSILTGIKDEEIEAEMEETLEFTETINLTLIALEEAKISKENEGKNVENASQPESSLPLEEGNRNTSSSSIGSKIRARLPKLQLSTFCDNFESVIDSNEDLSEIDKFSYLRASLSGSAASAIKGFPLTGSNYSGAVKLLKERYGDSQKIVSTHMDLLINLPAVLNGKDLKAMRQLSDDIEAHMRVLESLGCKPEQYGELFLPLLLNKIPKEIRLDICSKVSEKSWNFKSVLKQLNEELANRERCEIVAATKNPQEEHKRFNCEPYKQNLSIKNKGKCQGRHHTSICSQGKESRRQEMRSVESQTVEHGKQNKAENSTKQDQRNKDNTVPEESSTMCVNTKNAVTQLKRQFIDQINHIVNKRLESSLMEGVSEPMSQKELEMK
ncbi:Hypothetical predicted protein [Paramuricea clavata]|uniref:Uncharacterized protein n=1 Tax=Paramuricea clavata TaxID=317549 RepID=A0A7D9ELW9_PARCT|nr:Hypothetical predicted protein [Paramuricea clavata]